MRRQKLVAFPSGPAQIRAGRLLKDIERESLAPRLVKQNHHLVAFARLDDTSAGML
jgi:hypothetical protein